MNSRFPALQNPSFRAFWFAQAVSLPGTWMQNLALPWLAYTLTGSPFLLGLVGAVQFLPVMLLSLFAGALTDRLVKTRVVFVTQMVLALGSAVLSVLVFTHTANYPTLLAVALVLGLANTLDMPARQSMVGDLIGKDLFRGYVNWDRGELVSAEAAQIKDGTCPNCGGRLELAGKGLVRCPYCGTEIYLSGPGSASAPAAGASGPATTSAPETLAAPAGSPDVAATSSPIAPATDDPPAGSSSPGGSS